MNDQYLISAEILKSKLINQDTYPFNIPALQEIDRLDFHKNVTFLIGENGSGKSTLLEAIAIECWFNPEWGSQNFHFSTHESHSELSKYIRIAKWVKKPRDWYFLRAESFYNVASNIDKLDSDPSFWPPIKDSYWWISLHQQSHGESFFSLFQNRLFWNGIYIFDEPESALSPQRQLAFLVQLDNLIKENSQCIIATHSPIILSYPQSKIFELSDTWCREVSYEESSHYQLYKTFMDSPQSMIHKLDIGD